MIVRDLATLRRVVEEYKSVDAFVVDLETMYTPTPAEQERAQEITDKSPKERTVDEVLWLEHFKMRATDPLVNEIIWIGLATYGRSDVIPVGHPHGKMLKPARREKIPVSMAYPPGDPRLLTKSGAVSNRTVERSLPAVFAPPPQQLDIADVIEVIRPLFFSDQIKIAHNVKFDMKTLTKYFGEYPTRPYVDLMLPQHLLTETLPDYRLESLVKRHYKKGYEKLGKAGVHNFSFAKAALYTSQDCRYEWLLWRKLSDRLRRNEKLWRLLHEIDMEVLQALMRSEDRGVMLDDDEIVRLRREHEAKVAEIKDKLIVDHGAPRDFNPNAPVQVRELLYVKHKARVRRVTEKSQEPSTDKEALEEMVERGGKAAPVAQLLLDYADVKKTLGTYLIGMPHERDERGLLHPDFTLHGTRTGRLSCREPNVQNIPRESDLRNLFLPLPGHVFVVGDWDQIELRIIAGLSEDPNMCKLFISGRDIHRGTAALVLRKKFDDVTPDERQLFGKMPNFLIGFGGGAANLAAKTGQTKAQAQEVLDTYFRTYNRIRPWKDRVVSQAKARAKFAGQRQMVVSPYVETWFGRRRRLPELFYGGTERADKLRMSAERQAVNTVVQGRAAEILKTAIINLERYTDETGFPLRLAINVHDELVCMCPEEHAEEGTEILQSIMEGVVSPFDGSHPLGNMGVPLRAKVGAHERWEK